MSEWHFDLIDASQEDVVVAQVGQIHPQRGVSTVVVPGERRLWFCICVRCYSSRSIGKNSRLEQCLKAVADSEDQLVSRQKFLQSIGQPTSQMARKNDARADVVSIAETTRDTECLKTGQHGGIFKNSQEVDSLGLRAAHFKGVRGFRIAVRTRGS